MDRKIKRYEEAKQALQEMEQALHKYEDGFVYMLRIHEHNYTRTQFVNNEYVAQLVCDENVADLYTNNPEAEVSALSTTVIQVDSKDELINQFNIQRHSQITKRRRRRRPSN